MSRHSLLIGSLFGIPIRAHLSWILLFVVITMTLASAYFPIRYPSWPQPLYYALSAATSLLLFGSVLLHELAHSLVARRHGISVDAIVLFALGGVSEIGCEPPTPRAEWALAIAGPLASIALGIASGLLWLGSLLWGGGEQLSAVLGYLCGINISLGIFNLTPAFPLDGGRVLRAILWWRSRQLEWATRWAARVARLIALALLSIGIWQAIQSSLLNGLWLGAIGCFLDSSARASYQQVLIQARLAGHTVSEIMAHDYPDLSPDATLQEIHDRGLLEVGCRCIPLVENGALLGLLDSKSMKALPRAEWKQHTARQAMIPADELYPAHPAQALIEAVGFFDSDEAPPLPVLDGGRLVGVLPPERVAAFLKLEASPGHWS